MKKANRAFSLIELSIVILIIGVLTAAVGQGLDLLADARLSAARMSTQSSRVNSLKGLTLWLDSTSEAAFPSLPNDGDAIAQWSDTNPQNTYKNHALQATANNKPTYVANILNGLPAIKFDNSSIAAQVSAGTTKYLTLTNPEIFGLPTSSLTAFFVAHSLGSTAHQVVLRGDGAMSMGFGGGSDLQCGREVWVGGSPYGSWNPTNSPVLPIKQTAICSFRYNGSQVQGWTNSASADTAASVSGTISTPASTNVGGIGNDEYFNGYIAEIIVFNRSLSTAERVSVEKYLSKKWNIKIN